MQILEFLVIFLNKITKAVGFCLVIKVSFSKITIISELRTLHKKCPYSELFWSGVSLRIQSECEKMREKCGPESLWIRTFFTQWNIIRVNTLNTFLNDKLKIFSKSFWHDGWTFNTGVLFELLKLIDLILTSNTAFYKIVSLNLFVVNFSHLLILLWVILILNRVALNHTTRWTQYVNRMFIRRSKN